MSLLEDFSKTKYTFADFTIEIGKRHPPLDALLEKQSPKSWAIITAYNPMAKLRDAALNEAAQTELKKKLNDFVVIEGMNVAEDETWNEPSFLVLGISKIDAQRLAEQFQQAAIVYGELAAEAQLVFDNGT